MFTGIIEATGKVSTINDSGTAISLQLEVPSLISKTKKGDSLAVNGCCLTVVKIIRKKSKRLLQFDLLRETWARTNFHTLTTGALVNLERPLAATGRLHGHFVTGHIDGCGIVKTFKPKGSDWELRIDASPEILRYIVQKGSIAVDGISLTVAGVSKFNFLLWIIPHTKVATNLLTRKEGELVNLETDLLGKYVEKFLQPN